MTTELARATTDFTYYFRSLVAALGDRPGWYGVFGEREPAAARAYETGAEIPPWDVVRAVLHDLAAAHGAAPDPAEAARAGALHQAAVAAWDAAPGAEQALRARLEAAARAHDLALRREHEAARALDNAATAPTPAATARLTNLLAWSRDDRERAAARRDELWARLTALTPPSPQPPYQPYPESRPAPQQGDAFDGGHDGWSTAPGPDPDAARRGRTPLWGRPAPGDPGNGSAYGPGYQNQAGGGTDPGGLGGGAGTADADDFDWMFRDSDGPQAAEDEDTSESMFRNRTAGGRSGPEATGRSGQADKAEKPARAPRGARFAGAPREEGPPAPKGARFAAPPAADETVVPRGERSKPRGARFAGSPVAPAAQVPTVAAAPAKATLRGARFAGAPEAPASPESKPVDPRWADEARAGAARLGELRRTGQSGAAYLVLCEAAGGPPERIPFLARELDRTGLSADVATLLWEVAALPAGALAAAAAALAADERPEDCRTLLHQAAARPAPDIAEVAIVLREYGRADEAAELLETVVRGRPPEDTVEVARAATDLTPVLVAAADRVSKSRRRDIVAALRRAALPDR